LFQEWAQCTQCTWNSTQDRLLLLGILFGARALLAQMRDQSGDKALVSAACRSLLDLNSLAPFNKDLRRDVAVCLLHIPTPRTSSSCLAWVGALGMAIQGLATDGCPNEETFAQIAAGLDHRIFQSASEKLMKTIKGAADLEGWRPFIQGALGALSLIYTNQNFVKSIGSNVEDLRELAESVKAKLNDEVQAHKQADELLLKLECSTLASVNHHG
jgi:hypothetical protein